jgi:hypothetical protein
VSLCPRSVSHQPLIGVRHQQIQVFKGWTQRFFEILRDIKHLTLRTVNDSNNLGHGTHKRFYVSPMRPAHCTGLVPFDSPRIKYLETLTHTPVS